MAVSVPDSLEWAFQIDLRTFKMFRARNSVPQGSVVISKNKESDGDRTFAISHFRFAERTGLVDKSKPDVSELMSKRMVEYMQERRTWPPDTVLAKVRKNGTADLIFQPSQYDRFSLTLTPVIVGSDVEPFLNALAPQ